MSTKEEVAQELYDNLVSTLLQDIVARETTAYQIINSRYKKLPEYKYDPNGKTDINGNSKQSEGSIYLSCDNCSREISANRFAAHLQRCLGRGRR